VVHHTNGRPKHLEIKGYNDAQKKREFPDRAGGTLWQPTALPYDLQSPQFHVAGIAWVPKSSIDFLVPLSIDIGREDVCNIWQVQTGNCSHHSFALTVTNFDLNFVGRRSPALLVHLGLIGWVGISTPL
jgi:hypothetical protein